MKTEKQLEFEFVSELKRVVDTPMCVEGEQGQYEWDFTKGGSVEQDKSQINVV